MLLKLSGVNRFFMFMPRHDSSVFMFVSVVRAIIILLVISVSDLPSSLIKLPRYIICIYYVYII